MVLARVKYYVSQSKILKPAPVTCNWFSQQGELTILNELLTTVKFPKKLLQI